MAAKKSSGKDTQQLAAPLNFLAGNGFSPPREDIHHFKVLIDHYFDDDSGSEFGDDDLWHTLYGFTIVHSIFSVMAGLIVEILSCYSLFTTLLNGLKMSEYETYWLTDFPLIIYWVCTKK